MKTVEQTRRELFERQMHAIGKNPSEWLGSEWSNPYAQAAWIGFNAALDAVEFEMPPEWPPVCEKDDGANEMRDACLSAIESTNLGIKVK